MNNRLPDNPVFIDSLITVAQEMHLTMNNGELVSLFTGVFEKLLPSWMICFRLTKEDGPGLDMVYATGRLAQTEREMFKITQDSLEGFFITNEQKEKIFKQGRVCLQDHYIPVFDKTQTGFCFLLCDRKNLYGIINFELDENKTDLQFPRTIVLPFVHLLVSALRNARLMSQTIRLREYWEKLVDNANAPVVVVDRDGKTVLLNKSFEKLTGFTREEIARQEFINLVPFESRPRLLPLILGVLQGEYHTNVEMRFPKKSMIDEDAHIAFNFAPVKNTFGQIEGAIFIGQDLTLIRELQRQIIHSEKLATLGQVAAGVAHELNNPLTSITVYANYLLKKPLHLDEKDQHKLEKVLEGAERIKSFTKDLVSYARPSDDTPGLLQIKPIIEKSISFCEHIISEAKAELAVSIEDNLPLIYGVSGQLDQIFVNLITNACHALTQEGKIEIKVNKADESFVNISIKDTGIGISLRNQKRIFDPFFTTKDVGKGTGLGLSIVKNIIKSHSGHISVQSEEGVGTTFILSFRSC